LIHTARYLQNSPNKIKNIKNTKNIKNIKKIKNIKNIKKIKNIKDINITTRCWIFQESQKTSFLRNKIGDTWIKSDFRLICGYFFCRFCHLEHYKNQAANNIFIQYICFDWMTRKFKDLANSYWLKAVCSLYFEGLMD
jgi:hypothetical protein